MQMARHQSARTIVFVGSTPIPGTMNTNNKIHDWMKPFVEEFGMDPEVVRILGREGVADAVLEALKKAKRSMDEINWN